MRAHLLGTRVVVIAAFGLAVGGCVDDGPDRSLPPGSAVVEFVVDGDTIDVTIDGVEERVRLLGVDTPETKIPDTQPECYGPEAAAFTTSVLPVGTVVRLERDVVGRDDYGRLLAYVYRVDDGLFVNEELVRRGFAQLLRIEPNGLLHGRFVEVARAAERADVGLWGACGG